MRNGAFCGNHTHTHKRKIKKNFIPSKISYILIFLFISQGLIQKIKKSKNVSYSTARKSEMIPEIPKGDLVSFFSIALTLKEFYQGVRLSFLMCKMIIYYILN